jgi:hypothetical protein
VATTGLSRHAASRCQLDRPVIGNHKQLCVPGLLVYLHGAMA